MKCSHSRLRKLLALALVAPASFVWAQPPQHGAGGDMSSMSSPSQRSLSAVGALPPLPELPTGFLDAGTALQFVEPGAQSSYTLDYFLQLAAANNPTIRQARRQISGETAKALQAGLYPNPILMYVGEKINSGGRAGEFQGFELQQRFVTANKLQLSRLKYRQRAQVADHLAIAQQYRVSNDIQKSFYQTLAASERLTMQRELLKSAEDGNLTARELFNQGQTNLPGVRRANIELQQHRLDVLSAENQFAEAFRQLTAMAGCDLPLGWIDGSVRPQQTLPDFDSVYAELIDNSPEILAARAKLASDHTTVRRESVQWVPDVIVQGGPGYNFSNYDPVYNASVQLELPIHDWNQGTILQARHDLARQQDEIRRIELELRERLAMAYRVYATSLQHATEYENVIIPQRQQAYTELLQSYKEDRVDWPDVLEAQRDYFMARLQQIDYFRDVRIQETLIDGFLLEGGLMAAQASTPPGHIDSVPKPR